MKKLLVLACFLMFPALTCAAAPPPDPSPLMDLAGVEHMRETKDFVVWQTAAGEEIYSFFHDTGLITQVRTDGSRASISTKSHDAATYVVLADWDKGAVTVRQSIIYDGSEVVISPGYSQRGPFTPIPREYYGRLLPAVMYDAATRAHERDPRFKE